MKNYTVRYNGRAKPFEAVEWNTISHLAVLHSGEIIDLFVYSGYTVIHTETTRYVVEKNGTYNRKTWLE